MKQSIYTKEDKIITDFIYEKPEIVSKVLREYNYSLPKVPTLPKIIDQTFKALYVDKNMKFAQSLDAEIYNQEYANWVVAAITAAVAIAGMISSKKQAEKARDLQRKIALAQLSTQRMLEEERIRVGAETERTRILLETLRQYQSDLQAQSTARLKNTWVYVIMLGVSVAIVYGTTLLLSNDTK